jgi:hypothetical protein
MPWWGGGRKKKENTFFLNFQNDESPNTSNGISQVLVLHSQYYSLFKHPLTAEPAAQDLDAVTALIPTISLLRLTYLYLPPFFPEAILQDFTTKFVRDIVEPSQPHFISGTLQPPALHDSHNTK